jgi:hypothetical protein
MAVIRDIGPRRARFEGWWCLRTSARRSATAVPNATRTKKSSTPDTIAGIGANSFRFPF